MNIYIIQLNTYIYNSLYIVYKILNYNLIIVYLLYKINIKSKIILLKIILKCLCIFII